MKELPTVDNAKPIVSRRVWVVYPDSVRMGLSDENKPAAWFVYSDHAHRFGKFMWEGFYEVRYEEIHGGPTLPHCCCLREGIKSKTYSNEQYCTTVTKRN